MHRFLTDWSVVDHINGDGLDNRRSNLREVTSQQNAQNRRTRFDNKAGYKGVHLNRGRWYASLSPASGQRLNLGAFTDPESAARAYDVAALMYFGEYARLNFPRQENAA